jgi:hypothetical protein
MTNGKRGLLAIDHCVIGRCGVEWWLVPRRRCVSPILKLDHDDPEKELAFELDFQLSLTTAQRVERMLRRSGEFKQEMVRRGHRRSVEITTRECR